MFKKTMLGLFLIMAGGCATLPDAPVDRMASRGQHYEDFDAKIAWDVTSTGDATIISGLFRNVRYYEMDELELRAATLDDKGRETALATDFVYRLKENEIGQFTLRLPLAASGSRLRVRYQYTGQDGGGDSGGGNIWRQTFETRVP